MTYKIIIASQKKSLKDTLIYRSMVKNCINWAENVLFFGENTNSLPCVYNEGIKIAKETKTNIVVFVHDDVYINCSDFDKRIRECAKMFTVSGVAGNTSITVKQPVLWHLMAERTKLRGCVAHGADEKQYMYTSYGPVPGKALLIDGVFMILNLDTLPDNVIFDENCPAKFHFYDLIFSMECALNKVPVGVVDMPIVHTSPGLKTVTQEWTDGQTYFLEKYKQFSGKTLIV